MRYIYTFLMYLALPFIFLRLGFRSWREPSYRKRLSERLGFYSFQLDQCIWVHAVSVGETMAALPLINALQTNYPQIPIVVTTMTPTGAKQVMTALGDKVKHLYLPYDLPSAMRRFLQAVNPRLAVIMETELWPNLLMVCQQKSIPVCLMNARMSLKSARGYQRIKKFVQEMLENISLIAAHAKADADRFIALGAPKDRVVITGNIKFDLHVPNDMTEKSNALRLHHERFIWIASSTHEGEEEIILAAHKNIMAIDKNALLILVPRHPHRFQKVATLCSKSFNCVRRSESQTIPVQANVYLGDTMGELLMLYGVADVAFVGGSLIARGGHNLLEPAILGKPILTGSHVFNFAEINDLLCAAKGLIKVFDAETLTKAMLHLMQHPEERQAIGERALQVVLANRGALEKQLKLLKNYSSRW